MKVYILVGSVEWEDSTVLGLFETFNDMVKFAVAEQQSHHELSPTLSYDRLVYAACILGKKPGSYHDFSIEKYKRVIPIASETLDGPELHPCPYSVEVLGDCLDLCDCDDAQMTRCAQEV